MRIVKNLIELVIFVFVVPVVIVGVSGILLSNLGASAHAYESKPIMEAQDITWDDRYLSQF